ncbi:hypothetical protein ABK040_009762 [Willaertia magna]
MTKKPIGLLSSWMLFLLLWLSFFLLTTYCNINNINNDNNNDYITFNFYLNSAVEKSQLKNCNTTENPCNSFSEILYYLDSLNDIRKKDDFIINIYFLSDFVQRKAIYFLFLKNKLKINYFGENNLKNNLINLDIDHNPFESVKEKIIEINFNNLNIVSISDNNYSELISYNFTDCNIHKLQIAGFQNILFQNIKFILTGPNLKRGNNIDFVNCEISGGNELTFIKYVTFLDSNFTTAVNNEILDLKFRTTFNSINEILINNCNFNISFIIFNSISVLKILRSFSSGSIKITNTNTYFITFTRFKNINKNFAIKSLESNGFISECEFINNLNPIIIENLELLNYYIYLYNNIFKQNKSDFNGGAISIVTKSFGRIEISYCQFIDNYAKNSGGAFYLSCLQRYTELKIVNCNFIENSVFVTSETNNLNNNFLNNVGKERYGNGGAICIENNDDMSQQFNSDNSNSIFIDNNCQFIRNKALRGGALYIENNGFTKSSSVATKNMIENFVKFQNNFALLAGGILFTNNLQLLNQPLNFKNSYNNIAKIYGNLMASYVTTVLVDYFIDDVKVDYNENYKNNLIIYPGQSFGIKLKQFDVLNQNILQQSEPIEYLYKENDKFKLILIVSKVNGYYGFYFLQYNRSNYNSEHQQQEIIFIFQQIKFTVNITITTNCPSGMEAIPVENNSIACQLKQLPISTIITISIIIALLFFLIGIAVGLLLIYGIWKILLKLKKLEKKENAEMEIERKIIDKRTVFGIVDVPLLSKDNLKKESSSFLIPIEELKIDKKIGEGGCGTVFCGKVSFVKTIL